MAELLTTKELRTKSLEQLQTLLSERREKLRHLRFQVSSREVKNNQELKFSRKEIARILTIINDLRKQS
ncbi:MAG: 50S ribosomal protein L29 [bacterium]|nr:50S ribosomal protein L29 [bacterium]